MTPPSPEVDARWLAPVALAFYDAAASGAEMAPALDLALAALSADTAFVYVARLEDGQRFDFHIRGVVDPAMIGPYAARWARLNQRARAWPELPDGGVVDFDAVVPPAQFRRTALWRQFLRHHIPMLHVIGLAVSVAPGLQARFGFGRTPESGPFPADAKRRLGALAPHLRRAAAARLQALTRAAATELAGEVLATVSLPVARHGADGRFLGANAALQALAARRDGFTLGAGGVEPLRPEDRAALAEAIRAALDGDEAPARFLPIRRREAAVPYLAKVIATPERQVLVVVKDPAAPVAARTEDLAALFGLTEAQAMLARDIGAGLSLAAHAEAAMIPRETARSRLKAVLARTGCRRQADLAALIARLPITG
jgi:PAS domain-containing protein